jgi:WD40 repeat protein
MTLHLTRDSTMTMTIGDIMDKFNLPYLCGALADSLDRVNNGQPKIGGRRAANTNTPLPFDHLQVWTKVQLQNRPYHTPHHIIPLQTINALPLSEAWTSGRCDVVFINTDNKVWPHSGLEGVSSSCKPVSSTNFPTRFQGIGPFTGPTGSVSSVAFLPDGQHIISDPFTRHTGSVSSVAFSPNGHHIISGSSDGSIRVWNAQMGETAAGPFTGPTSWVRSVAFLPDGQHIVSGSEDRSIRVWNAKTGETAAGPFTGHTSLVSSVAFSPDGQHIVSGSEDRSIRVWNAITRETAAGLYTGHTGWVRSVAFAPDGQHIISGSSDGLICIWNAEMGETAAGPFAGHPVGSGLWHSRPMASTSSQALLMDQFTFGMQRWERQWQALSQDTPLCLCLWNSRPMASRLSRGLPMN